MYLTLWHACCQLMVLIVVMHGTDRQTQKSWTDPTLCLASIILDTISARLKAGNANTKRSRTISGTAVLYNASTAMLNQELIYSIHSKSPAAEVMDKAPFCNKLTCRVKVQ